MPSPLYRSFRLFRKQIYRTSLLGFVPRQFSHNGGSPTVQFKTFNDMISFRRFQAEKSVLIGINSESHVEEVLKICERLGAPTRKIVFRPGNYSEHQLVCLVEYDSTEEAQHLLSSCHHVVGNGSTPVFSRLLCHHHHQQSGRGKGSAGGLLLHELQAQGRLEQWRNPTDEDSLHHLSSCQSGSEQVDVLYKQERLHDLGSRLRFLLCTQLEDALRGLLPHCQALPFGSSVNGFGNYNCDLDISLNFFHSGSRQGLTFQCPSVQTANERARTQMTLEVLGDLIQNFFPCVSNVQRILRARVPILKIHHTLGGLDCDISMANDTGLQMSELLFLLGELDRRVRPLVFAVRKWARSVHLTRETGGHWITNFSLTLMVIFFLQSRAPPVLPTVQRLKDLAGPEDVQTASGVDCTFKRDFTQVPLSENTEDVGSLLVSFFWFCADMRWKENGLSLVTGEVVRKPGGALFIENPLERHLNVCSIVTNQEVDRFVSAVKDVLWELEGNPSGKNLFKFLLNRSDGPVRSRMQKGLIVSQLFEKSSARPAKIQRNVLPETLNVSKTNEKVEKTNRSFSSDLNAELSKLHASRRAGNNKKTSEKHSRKSNKLFSSADLWKIL